MFKEAAKLLGPIFLIVIMIAFAPDSWRVYVIAVGVLILVVYAVIKRGNWYI